MDRPKLIENPDLSSLIRTLERHVDSIGSGKFHEDDDDEHYIYEEAVKAFYGDSYWEFRKEKVK